MQITKEYKTLDGSQTFKATIKTKKRKHNITAIIKIHGLPEKMVTNKWGFQNDKDALSYGDNLLKSYGEDAII